MPELPEVETIVRDLNRKVRGLAITDAWTDWPRTIRTHSLEKFKKDVKGRKILDAYRRAKYIMLDLSGGKTLIIHQKISGHLLYGKWLISGKKIEPATDGPIKTDPQNKYIRFALYLNNGYMLGLSDLRRFGRVYLGETDKIEKINEIGKLGPEPLDPKFTLTKFRELISKKRGKIKKVLMDPFTIVGIGNIYGDEILWYAGISPTKSTDKLTKKEVELIYKNTRMVLQKAIKAQGDSQQDYRKLDGTLGGYQNMQRAYHETGNKCQKKDGGIIKRVVINNRSAHYCPVHQK